MSLLSVLDRLDKHIPRPFIAPVPNAQWVELFLLQDSIPYRFSLYDAKPGWWNIRPITKNEARLDEAAPAWAVYSYLRQLPRFYVIILFRVAERTWLCIPYNAADAAQRGWANGEPRSLHLIRHAMGPFDVAVARDLAGMLLYEDINTSLHTSPISVEMRRCLARGDVEFPKASPDFRNAYEILSRRRQEVSRQQQLEAIEARQQGDEGQVRFDLEFMGASLLALTETGEGYSVTWEFDGCTHTTRVGRDMKVQSAGICLDSTDKQHDLSSIVQVMERARELHRFDLKKRYYK